MFPSSSKKYKFYIDSYNYKDILKLFNECIELIDKQGLIIERFSIFEMSFSPEVAKEWLKNANEKTIRIYPASVSDKRGGFAKSMSVEIANGITYWTGCKEMFYVDVDWSYKESEININISTDIEIFQDY